MPHYSRPLPIPQNQHLTFAEISARMYVKIADFDLIFSSHDPLAINNELEEEPPTISDNEYCDAVVLKENENYVTLDDVEKFKRKTKEDNLLLNKNPGFCRVQSFDKFDAWSYTNSVASSWDSKDDFLSENEGDLLSSAEENLTKKTLKKVGIFENIIFLFFQILDSLFFKSGFYAQTSAVMPQTTDVSNVKIVINGAFKSSFWLDI